MKKIAQPVRQNKSPNRQFTPRANLLPKQSVRARGWGADDGSHSPGNECADVFIVPVARCLSLDAVVRIILCLQIPLHLDVCVHRCVFTVSASPETETVSAR